MKKPYEAHEIAYKKMKEKGVRSWDENQDAERKAIDSDTKRFLVDVLAQPWAPKSGRAVELGCGTGPILRWICRKSFTGLGIDVSKTAISMAREQSRSLNVKYKRADICRIDVAGIGKFDLVIDGHCLHCIIRPCDRKKFLKNSFKLLKKTGVLVVSTMCCPYDREIFLKECGRQRLINHTIYAPYDEARQYEDSVVSRGKSYMPTRNVPHWKNILSEICEAGFRIKLLRYNEASGRDPFGSLSVAGLA